MHIRRTETQLSATKCAMLQQVNATNYDKFTDCYRVKHKPGASLYQPINADPYVVQFGEAGAVCVTFVPDNHSSGTDAMRARIIAERYYEEVKHEQH